MQQTFLALLHFDGGAFQGWQRQPAGRSVQTEFERVLERLTGEPTPAHAAGRTDAGVHAQGLGVSFSLPSRWRSGEAKRAINALLPGDCWVEAVAAMQPRFHARKHAIARRYRYDVGTDEASASPFRCRYEWPLARQLDWAALQAAAAQIRGAHDFTAFSVRGQLKPHHRSVISESHWTEREELRGVSYHVEADRFLHHMVRMLVGTMVDIGLGRRPLADMAALLVRGDNLETSPPAPAQGLYFVAARYPRNCYAEAGAAPAPVGAAEEVS
ncbi:MAG TPA: tRNA pseudouridine(38-40) synthase TruA [Gemmatimonadales bacterium]|nr:tRNA pseudouridine(38-40) synthase TruA [Gemmatimonadales bacterium]